MNPEPVLALSATPRAWAQRLHRHVTDHGGARIRATVLTASEALAERYDVLLTDDRTSFLSPRLVRALHDTGRLVLGLYDPDDPQGKSDLVDAGVDDSLPADVPPADVLSSARALVRAHGGTLTRAAPLPASPPPSAGVPRPSGGLVVVRGGRGAGRTEVALGLAASLAGADHRTVLVELDETHACLAPRLGLPPYPNLRAAVEWSRQSIGSVAAIQRAEAGLGVLVAGPRPTALTAAPPDDLVTLIEDVAAGADWTVVDLGDEPRWQAPGHAISVLVGSATPVGAFRLQILLAELDPGSVHLVVNHAPPSGFRRWEFLEHVARTYRPRSVVAVPYDPGVTHHAWHGRAAATGPFGKAMARLADEVRGHAEGSP